MKFVRKSSHSWWWDSHNTPKRSRWLQSALGELDEKTKAMLQLIEEDADSFAQRAEMYYKKRPELIDLVEEFYRAYRSLAERYDHLKDETRHGIPRVVQVQCGISRENPFESPFGEQILPWRNGSRGFRQLLKRQESRDSDSEASEVDDPEPEGDRRENAKSSDRDSEDLSALSSYESGVDNPSLEVTEDESSGSRMREMQDTISNLQEEKARVLIQLSAESLHTKHSQDEINNLKKERNSMKGEMSLIVQEKGLLENELHKFKTELKILRNRNEDIMQQMQVLGKDVNNLQEENGRLSKQNKIFSTVLGYVGGQAATLAKTNASSRNKICEGHQQCKEILEILKDEKEKFENMLEAEVKRLSELNLNIDDFQGEICRIGVENRQKKIPLLDHNEEKREIQRQLCFAEASDVDDPEPEADRKENVKDPDEDFDDLCAGSSCESEVDDPPQKVAGNERGGSRMREMQATISRLQGEKARLLKQLSAKSLQSRHLKDKLKILKKHRNFVKEEISPVIQDKGVLEKDLSKFETEHRILRNQNEDVVQHMQALGKDVNDLREENRRLSQQNKIMATVLGFVSGQAASLARSNVRLRNEMCEGNRRCKAILQILKDEEKKFDNMFEEEVKCVSELDLNIAELQGEICRLAEENQHQKITLLDLSEEKREAIRQLCFAMDALRGRNQRLEAAIGCYRGGGSCSKLDGSSQFSRWKKFLTAALDGNGPQSCILAI